MSDQHERLTPESFLIKLKNKEIAEAKNYLMNTLNLDSDNQHNEGKISIQKLREKLIKESFEDALSLLKNLTTFYEEINNEDLRNLLSYIRRMEETPGNIFLERYCNLVMSNNTSTEESNSLPKPNTNVSDFLDYLLNEKNNETAIRRLKDQLIARDLYTPFFCVPGERLNDENFDYRRVTEIPDPNCVPNSNDPNEDAITYLNILSELKSTNLKTSQKSLIDTDVKTTEKDSKNLSIAKEFERLYLDYIINTDEGDIILQPIVGSIFDEKNGNLYTNIYLFENFSKELVRSDFEIRQDFTIGNNGSCELGYYISFRRSGADRRRSDDFRMHKFSIKTQKPIKYVPFQGNNTQHLDLSNIKEVMACAINVNPVSSRGTTTTVKNASGG